MTNYLAINEAIELSGVREEIFHEKYLNNGQISVIVENGNKHIEISEFLRVFPDAKMRLYKLKNQVAPELDLQLKQMKIEYLEYRVSQLERQLEKQIAEYDWLRHKFDNSTLLLEQKMDNSELDKYKQEVRQLNQQIIAWEKKYNALVTADEFKSLLNENNLLKQQLQEATVRPDEPAEKTENLSVADDISLDSPILTSEDISKDDIALIPEVKSNRRKLFGLF